MKINLHELIKNNENTFNLSVEELYKIFPKQVDSLEFLGEFIDTQSKELIEDYNWLKILVKDYLENL